MLKFDLMSSCESCIYFSLQEFSCHYVLDGQALGQKIHKKKVTEKENKRCTNLSQNLKKGQQRK